MPLHLTILGGDIRQYYMLLHLIKWFSNLGISYHIVCYQMEMPNNSLFHLYPRQISSAISFEEAVLDCDILIAPVPFTKTNKEIFSVTSKLPDISDLAILLKKRQKLPIIIGGQIPDFLQEAVPEATFYDFMKDEDFLKENSELTAEGLLKNLIENTPFSLYQSQIFINGFGKCGTAIAKKLAVLGAEIFIYDTSLTAVKAATEQGFSVFNIQTAQHLPFDLVINTVPSPVLKAPFLRLLKQQCVLFDIASAPGGFDHDIIQGLSLNLIQCPAIPGKTAPASAGKAISNYIEKLIERNLTL